MRVYSFTFMANLTGPVTRSRSEALCLSGGRRPPAGGLPRPRYLLRRLLFRPLLHCSSCSMFYIKAVRP